MLRLSRMDACFQAPRSGSVQRRLNVCACVILHTAQNCGVRVHMTSLSLNAFERYKQSNWTEENRSQGAECDIHLHEPITSITLLPMPMQHSFQHCSVKRISLA